jgi:hypothetical protein
MEVDGETMEHIIRSVGMEEQMLGQLFLTGDDYLVSYLIEKRNRTYDL